MDDLFIGALITWELCVAKRMMSCWCMTTAAMTNTELFMWSLLSLGADVYWNNWRKIKGLDSRCRGDSRRWEVPRWHVAYMRHTLSYCHSFYLKKCPHLLTQNVLQFGYLLILWSLIFKVGLLFFRTRFASCHTHASLLTFFICFFVLFRSWCPLSPVPCANVWEKHSPYPIAILNDTFLFREAK